MNDFFDVYLNNEFHLKLRLRQIGCSLGDLSFCSYEKALDESFHLRHYEVFFNEHGFLPPRGFHIHHIDGDRFNNTVENLIALPELLHRFAHRDQNLPGRETLESLLNIWFEIHKLKEKFKTCYFDLLLYYFWYEPQEILEHVKLGLEMNELKPGFLSVEWGEGEVA
jgi:hypothetical protein